jgi:signal transduction histidine kinase
MQPKAPKQSFLWQAILILLPLALLAGLGIFSLRQDKMVVELESSGHCASLVGEYDYAIYAAFQNPPPAPFSEITLDSKGRLFAIGGSLSRAMMPENAVPHPLLESALTEEQRTAWHAARTAEFTRKGESADILKKFIALAPPPQFLTEARYDLGLQYASAKNRAAEALFSQAEKDTNAFSEGGLPLFLLAQYQRWKLDGAQNPAADILCSNAVEHPSLISPVLLQAVRPDDPKWRELWRRDEAAREFYNCMKPSLTNQLVFVDGFWVAYNGEDWVVFAIRKDDAKPAHFTLAAIPKPWVADAVRNAEPLEQRRTPYAQAAVTVVGKEILPRHSSWRVLAGLGTEFTKLGADTQLAITEELAKPELLYARARARTEWFAALILVSAAAALAGVVSAYRGFRQQILLNELKSNFVSSVSHELRAPIASMRLLAESLERGTIADSVKQKEYFGLLVQESRRLSMMIENILDFSRIERGGKKYEFELADVGALAEDTIRLMRPCAAERQVDLALQQNGGAGAESFACDGLALQQALINLIDNAVKHSPPGGRVAVGSDAGAAGLSLWVEDNGPGIPQEEHAKIFERFYRRGTELRRETQGIGIGLTIVQHIVEAHGGRVTVRSAPGQGSRFTMELPRK